MNAKCQLELFERIAAATARMADAAGRRQWEALVVAERDCSALVDQARRLQPTTWRPEERRRKEQLLRAMLADDAAVRAATNPEMARLESLLGEMRRTGRAREAYRLGEAPPQG